MFARHLSARRTTVSRPTAGTAPRRSRSRRLVAALTVSAGLGLSLLSTAPAEAMNPAQTQYSGVVNLLGGTSSYSIRNFWATTVPRWGYRYTNPTLRYYTTPVATRCGTLSTNNSFWCSGDWTIWLDYNWNQGLVNRNGDFGAGGVLAHEWAHAADSMTGTRSGTYKDEYHADCMAGLYYRYGYAGGRLLGADYYEFYNWLYYQPYSPSHGTGTIRAAWFHYGYSMYTKAACDSVYRASAAATGSKAATSTLTGTQTGTPTGTSSGRSAAVDTARLRSTVPPAVTDVAPGQLPTLDAKLSRPSPTAARR
jgi:hypothetical protein